MCKEARSSCSSQTSAFYSLIVELACRMSVSCPMVRPCLHWQSSLTAKMDSRPRTDTLQAEVALALYHLVRSWQLAADLPPCIDIPLQYLANVNCHGCGDMLPKISRFGSMSLMLRLPHNQKVHGTIADISLWKLQHVQYTSSTHEAGIFR